MRLPDFLVVGAMKAGTTSLCNDLKKNDGVFFPSVKEPHTLVARSFEKPEHYEEYRKLFESAKSDHVCGEGSTGYTKLHKFGNVPKKAKKVLGRGLKIVYIVRNPVQRIRSHHYHIYRKGEASKSVDDEIENNEDLIKTSKYWYQIEPWIREFREDNVKVVKFEEYIGNRKDTINELKKFLNVEKKETKIGRAKNEGEKQKAPPRLNALKKVLRSQWYKRKIHPSIPDRLKEVFKKVFYRNPKKRPSPPSEDKVYKIIHHVKEDVKNISNFLEREKKLWSKKEMLEAGKQVESK